MHKYKTGIGCKLESISYWVVKTCEAILLAVFNWCKVDRTGYEMLFRQSVISGHVQPMFDVNSHPQSCKDLKSSLLAVFQCCKADSLAYENPWQTVCDFCS